MLGIPISNETATMPGGRQKGTTKTGGRQKGTPNAATMDQTISMAQAQRIAYRQLKASGDGAKIQPLDVLLLVMRTAAEAGHLQLALSAAERAAPYCHPRLSSMEMSATVRRAPTDFTDQELRALAGEADPDDEKKPTLN